MPGNLAIIPARAGSKGIVGKNIRLLCGKPLIAWSIEAAIRSRSVDRVVVSTDCEKIAQVAREYGAETPFLRPDEISGDTATTESALLHCISWLEQHEGYVPDYVTLLQATSPIRAVGSVDHAFDLLREKSANSLLSVSEFWHFLWESKQRPKASYDFNNRPRRQDIKLEDLKFKENGSIYITERRQLELSGNRLSGKLALHEMPDEESFEIDTDLDWLIVEAILAERLKRNGN